MKKKLIIGMLIYSLIFLVGAVYMIFTVESARSRLDKLITLHQVEILREHYLIQIKRVQSDLLLKSTSYSRSFDTVVSHVMNMGRLIDSCFTCHHSPDATARLGDLRWQTDRYKDALSRVLTNRANAARLHAEELNAFRIGEELTAKMGNMIAMTSVKLGERTARALLEISRTKYVFYCLIGFVPFLSGVFAFVLIKSLTSPMSVLLESTRRLKSGDLDHRVEGLKDEFGELAVSINEMAGSLKEQMEKMQRTEQMVVAAELAAGLAHEIKNPLAGIKVAMSVLSEEFHLPQEDREIMREVVGETVRLEALMKSFLNFTKPPKPQLEPINVNNLLNTMLAFYIKNQTASGEGSDNVDIVKEFAPLPVTKADPMQLQQVFLNIILNAIHAMPGGGTLTVRTFHDRTLHEEGLGFIRIEIADTGKGIDSAIIDKIFQPFFTTKAKGTGLGLAICRQLIEQHEGTIGVSNNPGGGSTFRVVLPATLVEEKCFA